MMLYTQRNNLSTNVCSSMHDSSVLANINNIAKHQIKRRFKESKISKAHPSSKWEHRKKKKSSLR